MPRKALHKMLGQLGSALNRWRLWLAVWSSSVASASDKECQTVSNNVVN